MTRKGLTFPEDAVSNGRVGTARIRAQIGATAAVLASPAPAPLTAPLLGMVTKKPPKYRNEKCEVEGIKFDSRREAARWVALKGQEEQGLISGLRRQVRFEIAPAVVIQGRKRPARYYVADFVYLRSSEEVIEDVKGHLTAEYRLKRHLMAAKGLTITEIK
ncbi:DUF1064 domain-containing protein [Pandoraea bronchicola]|uniref:DUF1064 domain-containing protein n=1 Tax=Pandoraea bronchicola TaxID=2508287 RepID=A0A5E5BYK8_9BURK|nr:DUF1064 domain-containing protein [Pandoraea bronchicola]VVE90416.1 hypothetical protein PBR20603_04400 [Pandoraea bronchicola]